MATRLQMEKTLGLADDCRSLQRIKSIRRSWPMEGSLGRESHMRVDNRAASQKHAHGLDAFPEPPDWQEDRVYLGGGISPSFR